MPDPAINTEASGPSDDQSTCLFTGELLSRSTEVEHTIPQAVGGRIQSRHVSAPVINHKAGQGIEKEFARFYATVFNRLSLLTPSEHTGPSLPMLIDGVWGTYEMRPGGAVRRKKLAVEKDPKTGRIVAANAGSEKKLQEFMQNYRPPKLKGWERQVVPASDNTTGTVDGGVFSQACEAAALKAILLTCDHLLRGHPQRFTRSPQLAKVREFVRRWIVEDATPDFPSYSSIVLGLQYDKLAEVQRIRSHIEFPPTPFEHLMIVSGNTARRAIDAVWWVAGIDPLGFRLCDDWREYPFTFAVTSGVLRNTKTVSQWLPQEFSCRKEPNWRAIVNSNTPMETRQATARGIGGYHCDAIRRAIDEVERNCPEFVCKELCLHAQVGLTIGRGGRIVDALADRLRVLFGRRIAREENRKLFEATLDRHFQTLPPELFREAVKSCHGVQNDVSWDRWFQAHIEILSDLRQTLGTPGEVGVPAVEIEVTPLSA